MPALRAPNRGLRTADPEPQTPNRRPRTADPEPQTPNSARGLQPRAQNFV